MCNRDANQADEEDDQHPLEEPSWELPAHLQKFQGEADDRKGMLTFRQEQQAARQVTLHSNDSPEQISIKSVISIASRKS